MGINLQSGGNIQILLLPETGFDVSFNQDTATPRAVAHRLVYALAPSARLVKQSLLGPQP